MLHLCYGVLKTGLAFDPDYLPNQKQPNQVQPAKQLQPA